MKETAKYGKEVFQLLGGLEGIRALANCLYDIMEEIPEARNIRKMHPKDLNETRENLTLFLCGWLGGPSLYVKKHGSVNLTDIHLPLEIGAEEKAMWLSCMEKALKKQAVATELKIHLMKRFRVPAEKIRLACQEQLLARSVIGAGNIS